ncbi:MAG: hypothetical protein GPOALKHO_000196 [Sodalis sp.]|uniref:hypothetical protein n=1 Tax=Sodalis sp. (in: enterobacteria) TaxID=1898979 RepID=UPI003872AFA6|nr:MAG: hypothetical protein GPOALKHO_000196 [Sodalis sp.]
MTVQILLNHNDININRVDQLSFTPIMRAAQGNPHAAIELLIHPVIAINLRNISGMSALSLVVERGHTKAVQQCCIRVLRHCSSDMLLTRRRPSVKPAAEVLWGQCPPSAQSPHTLQSVSAR